MESSNNGIFLFGRSLYNQVPTLLTISSLLPAGVAFSHFFLTGWLSVVVVRTTYRSYLALPPSSATRHRQSLRRGHVQLFSFLAAASLATAFYFGMRFASLSYMVWAAERGVELPEGSVTLFLSNSFHSY